MLPYSYYLPLVENNSAIIIGPQNNESISPKFMVTYRSDCPQTSKFFHWTP